MQVFIEQSNFIQGFPGDECCRLGNGILGLDQAGMQIKLTAEWFSAWLTKLIDPDRVGVDETRCDRGWDGFGG